MLFRSVWAPAWVKITPEDFKDLGAAARLSEYEILVGLELGFGPGALRAVEHRIELRKLEPVTPVDWRYDGEPPPARKSRAIEAAVNSITEQEYAGYIKRLQDFKTRATDTPGCDAARDYIRSFFAAQNLEGSLFGFKCIGFKQAHYPRPPDDIFVVTNRGTLRRTRDGGVSWDRIIINGTFDIVASFWLDADVGCFAAYNSLFAKTEDGGDNWETFVIRPGYPLDFYVPNDICFVNPDTGWVVGQFWPHSGPDRGSIMKTDDGGRTWLEQPVSEDFRPRRVNFYDVNYGWLAGSLNSRGCIYYTDDAGATWRECTVPEGVKGIEGLAATGDAEAWATDNTERLLHTTDGMEWRYVVPGFTYKYRFIAFPDRDHGFAAKDALIATYDGGATWHEVGAAPKIEYWVLAFADKANGIIGDYTGEHLYRTNDAGASFVSIIGDMDQTAENVIGERPGAEVPDEIVIIGGHLDSASDQLPSLCPGAEDNGSGTACAMAAARAFKDLPFRRTVRYVAFGDEESGMLGSEAYAKYCASMGEKIIAILNADMVAYDEEGGRRDDYAITFGEYDWLLEYLKTVGSFYGNKLTYEWGSAAGDHYSFWHAGYAAIGAAEGSVGPGGGPLAYPYYHKTEDTLDKLHPALGVRFVRDYAAMFAHLAGFDDTGIEEPKVAAAAVPFARPFAVYPNPFCYATSAGGVNFVGIKSPAKVEIYDLAGRRVAREEVAAGCDACVWRPATPEGETLAPGVYLYRVEGQEQKKAGKIVIAR